MEGICFVISEEFEGNISVQILNSNSFNVDLLKVTLVEYVVYVNQGVWFVPLKIFYSPRVSSPNEFLLKRCF